jgi:ribosome-binding protein aMBF1 (putative translation factor)
MPIDPPKFHASVCSTIKNCRENLGISVEEFADKMRQPVSYVQRLEKGELDLSLKNVRHCASALGVRSEQLVEQAAHGHQLVLLSDEAPD